MLLKGKLHLWYWFFSATCRFRKNKCIWIFFNSRQNVTRSQISNLLILKADGEHFPFPTESLERMWTRLSPHKMRKLGVHLADTTLKAAGTSQTSALTHDSLHLPAATRSSNNEEMLHRSIPWIDSRSAQQQANSSCEHPLVLRRRFQWNHLS